MNCLEKHCCRLQMKEMMRRACSWTEMRVNMGNFTVLVILAQILGICAVMTVGIWLGKFLGGFEWAYKSPAKFNYHPLFMVIGLIYLYGNAILVYRVFKTDKKVIIKILHAVTQFGALGFAVIGLTAVFSNHNDEGFANLYSLHSWLGLSTVTLFSLQWLLGLIFFLFPQLSDPLKKLYMPHHRFWGVCIFIMATATALMGIVENTGFKVKDYSQRVNQSYVINFLGVFITTFSILISYLVTNENYKREPRLDEYQQDLNN